MNTLRFCKNCFLPSVYPAITFDEGDVCNVCTELYAKWGCPPKPLGIDALKEKLNNIIDKKARVQAIVTISGGKDSSYVLYAAVALFQLRVVAANFDNSFQSDMARENISTITDKLNVPLLTYKPPTKTLHKLYKGFYDKTGDFCTPCCIGCCASGFFAAQAMDTNVVLHGGISGSPYSFNVLGFLNHSFTRYCKHADGLDTVHNLRSIAFDDEQIADFNLISLPQYIDWEEKKVTEILEKELGWISGSDEHHADCAVNDASDYFIRRKFGFSKVWMYTSMLLRTKQITTQAARDSIRADCAKYPAGAIDLFFKKLNIHPHAHVDSRELIDEFDVWLKHT